MPKTLQKKNIHVVHIIPRLGFGGAERFVVELVKQVAAQGIRQTVITLWDERPLMNELPAEVKCISLNFNTLTRTRRISTMVELFHKLNATIIHTHLFSADVWGRLAARAAQLPVVTTEHNINKSEPKTWEWIKRFMKHYSTVYTAPSQAVADFMQQAYKISPKQIRLIPHGIDLKKFLPVPPAQFEKPFTLLIVGRLVEQKGHKIALDAIKKLHDVPCKLLIVGSGELEKELKNYAEKIGVGKRIEWRAATQYVPQVYRESDIVLVPSLWEGLGIVVLEAMASGRLVIASHVDGIRDSIESGVTGILVPAQNSDRLAEAIRKQLEMRKISLQIAEEAREWAKAHFDVKAMAQHYTELYREL